MFLGTMGWIADARAAGFATQKFGGELGNPVATNPTALYYNPAGIAFSEGWHIYFDESVAFRSVSWNHPPGQPGDPTDAPANIGNDGQASLFNVFTGPTMGITAKVNDYLAIGGGVFVPFAGREHWDQTNKNPDPMYPLSGDGPQRWSSIDGSLTFLYGTVGAALKFGPLAIGATGNLIYSWVQFTKAQNLGGINTPNSAAEGRAKLNVSGANGSFGLGAMVEPWKGHLWLGAGYQAQPGLGDQTLKGTFDVSSPTPGGSLPQKKATFTQGLPDVFRAGIRFRPIDAIEIRAFGDYTRWSRMKSQCVALEGYKCQVYPDGSDASGGNGAVLANFVRDWGDTMSYRGGVSWYANPDVEIFAGGGYETGATPDATLDPTVSDANNYQGALGGRFNVADWIYVSAQWTQIMYADRDTTGKSIASRYKIPTQQPDGGGQYKQWVGIFDLILEKQF
jgi:long-chain fatty acid transport protein